MNNTVDKEECQKHKIIDFIIRSIALKIERRSHTLRQCSWCDKKMYSKSVSETDEKNTTVHEQTDCETHLSKEIIALKMEMARRK